jgi:hypothetical protein
MKDDEIEAQLKKLILLIEENDRKVRDFFIDLNIGNNLNKGDRRSFMKKCDTLFAILVAKDAKLYKEYRVSLNNLPEDKQIFYDQWLTKNLGRSS